MRKSDIFFCFIGAAIAILLSLAIHSFIYANNEDPAILEMKTMVKNLELTDLCLFAEARYTRHLSQTDYNTPFQDHPLSFEHFPSGSLVEPPPHVWTRHKGRAITGQGGGK